MRFFNKIIFVLSLTLFGSGFARAEFSAVIQIKNPGIQVTVPKTVSSEALKTRVYAASDSYCASDQVGFERVVPGSMVIKKFKKGQNFLNVQVLSLDCGNPVKQSLNSKMTLLFDKIEKFQPENLQFLIRAQTLSPDSLKMKVYAHANEFCQDPRIGFESAILGSIQVKKKIVNPEWIGVSIVSLNCGKISNRVGRAPLDVWDYIFSFLDSDSILNLSQVSKTFHFDLNKGGYVAVSSKARSVEGCKKVLESKNRHLIVTGQDLGNNDLLASGCLDLPGVEELESLEIRRGSFEYLTAHPEKFQKLVRLRVLGKKLRRRENYGFGEGEESRKVTVGWTQHLGKLPRLKELEVGPSSMSLMEFQRMLQSTPQLRVLGVSLLYGGGKYSGGYLDALSFVPHLESLSLDFNVQFDQGMATKILGNLHQLREIYLSHKIDPEGFLNYLFTLPLDSIRSLKTYHMNKDLLAKIIQANPSLEELEMDGWNDVYSFFQGLDMKELQVLTFSENKLDFVGFHRLFQEGYFPKLRKLNGIDPGVPTLKPTYTSSEYLSESQKLERLKSQLSGLEEYRRQIRQLRADRNSVRLELRRLVDRKSLLNNQIDGISVIFR